MRDDSATASASGSPDIVVIGGGAAGFFAAITCAELAPAYSVVLLEKSGQWLSKVRISGGGRCNVTHACFDPKALSRCYPRGGKELIGPFHRFQPQDIIDWFAARGVSLKTESDGRMFPVTDSSQTIIDCLVGSAREAGVGLRTRHSVKAIHQVREEGFAITLTDANVIHCRRVLLATGGTRAGAGPRLVAGLGHSLQPAVPSLFTFHIELPWLQELAGISVESVGASIPKAKLTDQGALLITHWGVSGPVILRLSAWGARMLHSLDYRFSLRINWVPDWSAESLRSVLNERRRSMPNRKVVNSPIGSLPGRLWAALAQVSGIGRETRWASLSRKGQHRLVDQLMQMELPVDGKSLYKEEFVTCGGVTLKEVNFSTMESRLCPGLHFAGEILDIDGITGGFNFQSAWTTGYLAGCHLAQPF